MQKADAETSVYLTIQLLNGEMTSLVIPTPNFVHFFEDTQDKVSELIIPMSIEDNTLLKVGDEITGIYFDATNDPTPHRAGGVVSLGYYCFRVCYKYCKVKSLAPFTLEGYAGDADFTMIDTNLTRPLRRVSP